MRSKVFLLVILALLVLFGLAWANLHVRSDTVSDIPNFAQRTAFCVEGNSFTSEYSNGRYVTFPDRSTDSFKIDYSENTCQDDPDTFVQLADQRTVPDTLIISDLSCLWGSNPSPLYDCRDTTPPTISSLTATDITQTTAKITWTTNEASSSRVEYGLTTSYGSQTAETDTNPRVTSHTVNLSGFSCNTTYNYRAKSKDAVGNEGISANKTFTTSACDDTTPPTISNIAASSITQTSSKITWTTNEAASSQVEYGTTTSYGSQTNETDTLPRVTSHTVSLSSLTCNTTYNYRVKSRDGASNLAISSNKTFATSSCSSAGDTGGGATGGGTGGTTGGTSGGTQTGGTSGGSTTTGGTKTNQGTTTGGTTKTGGQQKTTVPATGTTQVSPDQALTTDQAVAEPAPLTSTEEGIPFVFSNPIVQAFYENIAQPAAAIARQAVAPLAVVATATVAAPVALTAAASSAAASLSGFTLQPGLLRLLQLFSFSSFVRRRKPPWGETIDELTGAVLTGALVELLDEQFSKVVDRTVTDNQGRFVMLVSKPGKYRFRITAKGFRPYTSSHPFAITNIQYVPRSLSIALTPLQPKLSQGKLKRVVMLQKLATISAYIKFPLLAIGIAMTLITLINELALGKITVLTLAIGGLYILLVLQDMRRFFYKKPYGRVVDRATNKPLELAIVRAFKIFAGKKQLAITQVTDQLGRFSFLVSPGVYELDIVKLAYLPYKSSPHNLSGEHTLINEKIVLTPIHHG